MTVIKVRWILVLSAMAALVLVPLLEVAHTSAADICRAVALRDVRAVEDPGSILREGEQDGAITQYRVSRKTGKSSFCSHGGYCYPADSLKLLNCKVGAKDRYDDPENVFYDVDVVRAKVPPALLRYDDLDNGLLDMGLCNACASSAANAYIRKPHSRCGCGRIVGAALEGNPEAAKALKGDDLPINRDGNRAQVIPRAS